MFFSNDDRSQYFDLLAQAARASATRCLAWCLIDNAHLMTAVRYVERNPVAAGLVEHATDWRWSSARSHVAGRQIADDPLTDVGALGTHVRNWRAMLRHGVEAGELGENGEHVADAIEARLRTGRPLAADEWIATQEATLARPLAPRKAGRKQKGGALAEK